MTFLPQTEYVVYDTNANLDMIKKVAVSRSKDLAESIALKMFVTSGYVRDMMVYNPTDLTCTAILSEKTMGMHNPNAL